MNAPPDWQDGECCFRCRTQFTLVARKHHCRNCGNIFCAKCSSQQVPLPKLNIEKNVRVCDTCYEKITDKDDKERLALGPKEKEPKQKQNNKQKSASNSVSASTKSGANASAPSEQELKEEEELQLALALSLSETPAKVSFPDYRHLEQPPNATPKESSMDNNINPSTTSCNVTTPKLSDSSNNYSSVNYISPVTEVSSTPAVPGYDLSAISSTVLGPASSTQIPVVQTTSQPLAQTTQLPNQLEIVQERDLELFRYIGDIHGTLQVFNNRLEACKLRNRPITNDAAIQSLFIKLNSEIQPKLSEYIKTYEDEREVYERLQDKLSQISDARAALEALREEHQEKLRQLAAEADKQRKTQLATKLEAMRQKKTQMMQYQRELAMQRFREQELVYQPAQQQSSQQEAQDYQPTFMPDQQLTYQQSMSEQHPYNSAIQQHQQTVPHNQVSVQPVMPQTNSTTVQQQWLPNTGQNYQYQQPYVAPVSQSAIYNTLGPNTQVQQIPQQYNSYIAQQPQSQQIRQSLQQQPQPSIDRAALAHLEKQFLPEAKIDGEAPLISFDD